MHLNIGADDVQLLRELLNGGVRVGTIVKHGGNGSRHGGFS
jgi:hypothetical protein